jgi:HlyD family secretion protein
MDTITQQLSEVKANLNLIDSTGRKQISEAKTSLTRVNATGSKQISSAQATLNQIAEVNRTIAPAQQAKANLDQTYVKAPQNGVIFDVHTRAGSNTIL